MPPTPKPKPKRPPSCAACQGTGRRADNTKCTPCEGTGMLGGLKAKWEHEKYHGKGIRKAGPAVGE